MSHANNPPCKGRAIHRLSEDQAALPYPLPGNLIASCPVDATHKLVESAPWVRIYAPSGDQSIPVTILVCPANNWSTSPFSTSQTRAIPSYQAVAIWEPTGDQAIVAWAPFGDYQFRYLVWQKGTALADHPDVAGPNCQNVPRIMRLLPIAQTEKIIVLIRNNSEQLRYSLWDGDIMRGDPPILLSSNLPTGNERNFDTEIPAAAGPQQQQRNERDQVAHRRQVAVLPMSAASSLAESPSSLSGASE